MEMDRHTVLEMYVQYLPKSDEINYWMFAMIGVGMAFIAFVVISIYLICSDDKAHTIRHVRAGTVSSRVNVPHENGTHWTSSPEGQDDSAADCQLTTSANTLAVPPLTG